MPSLALADPTGFWGHFEVFFRLVLAVALAAPLGWDSEERERPARLRTTMLVALASAVLTVLTFKIFETVRISQTSVGADPIRIIEAVGASIAILAAGAIIQARNTARGLATGAGLWMAGALGVVSGAGHYTLGILGALLAFAILRLTPTAGSKVPGPTLIDEEDQDGDRRRSRP